MLNDKNDNRFLNALNDIDDDLVEEIAEAPVEPEIIPAVPKKSRFIRFIPAAASLAIVAAVGIGALIVGRNVFTPSGGGNTAVNESEPMSSGTEQSDIQTDSTTDTTPDQSASEEETGLSPSEISPGINTDIISELGMTYRQMTEKYGEARGGVFNTYEFGGYGRYTWKSYEGKFYDDMESAGGCNYIAGVKPKELFLGATFPMDLDELSKQYNLVPVSIDSEISMDNCYWAELTCQLYDNVKIVFGTSTYGIIDENTSCTVILDVDCLEAKPVITASSLEIPTEINTDIISELGMTFLQVTEKYGEALGGIYNTYNFGGYGRYTWKSYEGKVFDDDMESAGGCNYIDGVKPKELFLGAAFPMDLDELSKKYNLVPVLIESERSGLDNLYWSRFTCPLYDNVQFYFGSSTYGFIDETTSCIVILDVDCLEAKPVITASSSENPTETNTDTTSATVKDPESNSIKPNNGASDEEVAFLANAEQLVNSVEQIEELKRLLMEIEGVTDVQVYNSSDDSQNMEHQITEGKAAKGTIVKVFYDNGKSWVEYTKQ